jgi:spermidine synthase
MSPTKLEKLCSYIWPLQIEVCAGSENGLLEVELVKGKYVLNSEKINFSFGSTYEIFQRVFHDVKLENFNFSNCLLLGLGGGTVMNLLQKKYHFRFPVTAIEIDEKVVELGRKYFKLGDYKNLVILNQDAFQYVKNSRDKFDLIIVDIYLDDIVPELFHSKEFITALKNISSANAIILFNKMLGPQNSKKEYNDLVAEMGSAFGTLSCLSYVINGGENKVIYVNSKQNNSIK